MRLSNSGARWTICKEIAPELAQGIVDLIDGHVALREILSDAVEEALQVGRMGRGQQLE